ncbi:hypothetical protein DFH06DRAFT_1253896 [Mycena polygramma]|nr:hypothetical protein DFH06DRAFT_1253896 [Mycena polygramma]
MIQNSSSSTGYSAGQEARVCAVCTSFKSSPLLPDSIRATELRQILRGNVLPPAPVEAILRGVIQNAPAELARYDAEIERITGVLSAVASERATLAAHVQACRSVFSPVRRLPMELLGKIFEMCLSPHQGPNLSRYHDEGLRRLAKHDLLRLSKVYSFWHNTAFGTPRLWSAIVVDTIDWWRSPVTRTRALPLLAACLERSGGSPLSVCASLKYDRDGVDVMNLLGQHSQRWQQISWSYGSHDAWRLLVSLKGRLPLLKTLHLDAQCRVDVFETAPALTTVTLCGWFDDLPQLPWSQLRHLSCICPPLVQFIPRSSLSLAQLLGRGAVFRFHAEIRKSNLEWPTVSSDLECLILELGFTRETSQGAATTVGQILKSLTLPHLQRLQLGPLIDPSDDVLPIWNRTEFSAFALRSSLHDHLISLNIRAVITHGALLAALSAVPRLENLVIYDPAGCILVSDSLLQGMTWDPTGSSSLVPKLRYVNMSSLCRFSDGAYLKFITSRANSGHNVDGRPFTVELRHLSKGCPQLAPETQARLADLVSKGDLKFTLINRYGR